MCKGSRDIAEEDRDYYLNAFILLSVTWCHVILLLVKLKNVCDEGRGVSSVWSCLSGFHEAIERMGKDKVSEKYGNLFDMYERITGENPYEVPMRIYPAVHYVSGWSVG